MRTPVFSLSRPIWTGLCALISVCSAHAAPAADPRKPGTIKMAATLERIAARSNPMANLFLSRDRVAGLAAAMTANPSMTNTPEMMFRYGTELINAGENEKALLAFNQVEQLGRANNTFRDANESNVRLNQALCYLRMAEFRNCLSNHNADSCLLPIRGGGVHLWPDGSRSAIGILSTLLRSQPDNISARWLLNVAAMTVGDYPAKVPAQWLIPPSTFESDYDIKRFTDVAGAAGLGVNELSGGSAAEDFDGDGLLDLMVTSIGLRDQMHFFHNNGDGTFSDRTRALNGMERGVG